MLKYAYHENSTHDDELGTDPELYSRRAAEAQRDKRNWGQTLNYMSFVTPKCHRCFDAQQSMKEHELADGEAPSLRTLDAYIMRNNPLY